MIHPEELRIGNRITQAHATITVVAIATKYCVCKDFNGHKSKCSYENLKGVLLTRAIVWQYGFRSNEENTEYIIGLPNGNGVDLILEDICADFQLPLDVIVTTDKRDTVPKNFIYLKPVKYLHHLQNMYHSITHKELQVNP